MIRKLILAAAENSIQVIEFLSNVQLYMHLLIFVINIYSSIRFNLQMVKLLIPNLKSVIIINFMVFNFHFESCIAIALWGFNYHYALLITNLHFFTLIFYLKLILGLQPTFLVLKISKPKAKPNVNVINSLLL